MRFGTQFILYIPTVVYVQCYVGSSKVSGDECFCFSCFHSNKKREALPAEMKKMRASLRGKSGCRRRRIITLIIHLYLHLSVYGRGEMGVGTLGHFAKHFLSLFSLRQSAIFRTQMHDTFCIIMRRKN